MKILIKTTYKEYKTGSGRCSDGSYASCTSERSLKIFSDIEILKITIAIKLKNFINRHTSSYDDREFGGWSGDRYEENIDLQITEELISELNDDSIEVSELIENCPFLLNSIVEETIKSHELATSELKHKQSLIHTQYLKDLDLCRAEIAKNSFYLNEDIYDVNEILLDFNDFPLDVARISNDILFFNYLLSKGANRVEDPYKLAEWLCSIGKFEYLTNFVDLSKLQLIRVGSSIHNDQLKNYRLTECILYYAIINNRLDIFYKYGRDMFKKEISEVNYRDITQNNFNHNCISVGILAVKFSSIETVKELYGKCNFFENIKSNFGYTKAILSEYCFRDYETANFFMEKLTIDSTFGLLYWKKEKLLQLLIDSKKFDFSNIYLATFSEFFTLENNLIIEQLASINSFSLVNQIKKDHIEFIPRCWQSNMVIMKESVLEKSLINKNYKLFQKLFSLCQAKEKIESFYACRLLFMACMYLDNTEVKALESQIISLIESYDLHKLMSTACVKKNIKLMEILMPYLDNINTTFELEPTLFDLGMNNCYTKEKMDSFKGGTLIHLAIKFESSLDTIKYLLSSGVDKRIKDDSGNFAFDYVKYKNDYRNQKDLLELLYFEDVKICDKKGNLIHSLKNLEIPTIKEIDKYYSTGLTAVEAYKNQKLDVLNFYIQSGADINTIEDMIIEEKNRIENLKYDNDSSDYDDSYTESELRDMYRAAFDYNPDAEWNID